MVPSGLDRSPYFNNATSELPFPFQNVLAEAVTRGDRFSDPINQIRIQFFHDRLFHGGVRQAHFRIVEIEGAAVDPDDDSGLILFDRGYDDVQSFL